MPEGRHHHAVCQTSLPPAAASKHPGRAKPPPSIPSPRDSFFPEQTTKHDAAKTIALRLAAGGDPVAILKTAPYAGSQKYRDGILLWTLADGAMTLAEALRDDPNDPYVRGGVVYLVVRAIAPGQTLREILCSYAPEKQWLEDLPAGVPECEAPVPSRDRSPNGLRSGLL